MPTIIDSLFLELGLDPTKYRQGANVVKQVDAELREGAKATGEAAEKAARQAQAARRKAEEEARRAAKEAEKQAKDAQARIDSLTKAASGFLATLGIGAIGEFTSKTLSGFQAISIAANSMGLSAEMVNRWQLYMQRMGDTADGAKGSLQSLSTTMANARFFGIRDPNTAFAFGKAGISANDDPLVAMSKFFDYAHNASKTPEGKQEVFRVGTSLGLDPAVISAAEAGGSKGMMQGMADSAAMSDKQIADMARTRQAWEGLIQAVIGNANALVADTAGLTGLINGLTALVKMFPGATQAIIALTAAVVALKSVAFVKGIFGGGKGGGAVKAAGDVTEAEAAAAETGLAAGSAGGQLALGLGTAGIGLVAMAGIDALTNPETKAQKIAGLQAEIARITKQEGGKPSGLWLARIKEDQAELDKLAGKVGSAPTAHAASKSAAHAAAGGSIRSAIASFLLSHGIDPNTVAGILAGITAEGGLNPEAFNPTGGGQGAYGIGQWRGARLNALRTMFPGDKGHISVEHQLEFMLGELRGKDKGGASVLGARDAHGAMLAYLRDFMRPGAGLFGDVSRGSHALAGTQITIQQMTINGVKDAANVPAAMGSAINRNGLVQQANRGLS